MRLILVVVVAVVFGLALIIVPLFAVQRYECTRGDAQDEWTLENPFEPQSRAGCQPPQSGAELLIEFVSGG